jgi:uncharacterized protein (DUF2384 family)
MVARALFLSTSEFMTPGGAFVIKALCEHLGIQPADLARMTGRTTESVAKLFGAEATTPREERTVRVLRQLVQVVTVLGAMHLQPNEVKQWMRTPLQAFDGRTPLEEVAAGRGQELIGRLVTLASGNVST